MLIGALAYTYSISLWSIVCLAGVIGLTGIWIWAISGSDVLITIIWIEFCILVGFLARFLTSFSAEIVNSITDYYQTLPTSDRQSSWNRFWTRFFLAFLCGSGIAVELLLGLNKFNSLIYRATLGTAAGLVFV